MIGMGFGTCISTGQWAFPMGTHTVRPCLERFESGVESGCRAMEYKLISAASEQDVIDQANHLGIQGWELVSVVRVSASPAWRAFFKRATKD